MTSSFYEKGPWPPAREAYVGDQLLSIETVSTAHQEVLVSAYLDNEKVYQTHMPAASASHGISEGPWNYTGHWALVILDGDRTVEGYLEPVSRMVHDGQDMNTLHSYEQSLNFVALDDRSFYFYRKDGEIGISVDGQEIPRGYDEILQHRCCSFAVFNPRNSRNMVWFLARRAHQRYYVEAYVPDQGNE